MAHRRPTQDERRLLDELLRLANYSNREKWLSALEVEEMPDGGMGSLRLRVGQSAHPRAFGGPMAAVQFVDEDGVDVVATLNGDAGGEPFELDMWKTDFSPLIRIPASYRKVTE